MLLETIRQAHERTGLPVEMLLARLGLPAATYYRWQERAAADRLADRVVVPHRQALLPRPKEVAAVRRFSLVHPQTGYKRLTWQMVDENVACLRPYHVYRVLKEHDLLCRQGATRPEPLKRPPEPDHPDQV